MVYGSMFTFHASGSGLGSYLCLSWGCLLVSGFGVRDPTAEGLTDEML